MMKLSVLHQKVARNQALCLESRTVFGFGSYFTENREENVMPLRVAGPVVTPIRTGESVAIYVYLAIAGIRPACASGSVWMISLALAAMARRAYCRSGGW